MKITEVRIVLANTAAEGRGLKAYAAVTFDGVFVVHEVKVVDTGTGKTLVAMPSRKMTDHCNKCGQKNHILARYCNHCGTKLPEERAERDETGKLIIHIDMAHPTTSTFREILTQAVLAEYRRVASAKVNTEG